MEEGGRKATAMVSAGKAGACRCPSTKRGKALLPFPQTAEALNLFAGFLAEFFELVGQKQFFP